MAISFNGSTKRITLSAGVVLVDLADLYSRYKDWVLAGNSSSPLAMTTVGGEIPEIPLYLFLENGWRIVPQQADHVLTVDGGVLNVTGGGDPFVDPAGAYKIRINRQTPGIAIGYSSGGGGGASPGTIAAAVRAELAAELVRVLELGKLHGLDPANPLVVTPTSRTAGVDVVQDVTEAGSTVTVQRA